MYGSLLSHWNMLAVDNRGTGRSTPLNCPALQSFKGPSGTEAFQTTAASCAAALNHRWKYAHGGWVQASDLFSSAPAAEDMAAVIKALGLSKVDLYGDSYGSFFAQVFASRYPQLVRSVILDSTYETSGLDPWYRSTVQSMPTAFDAACSRWPACALAAPGSAWDRIGALAERLRQGAISGSVPGPEGKREQVTMNVTGLVDLISDAAEDTNIYGELDAAGRALLQENEPAPLLRLYAQREAVDEGYFTLPIREYSVELYVADACVDYPQLFDMSKPSAQRMSELAAAETALPQSTFAPFTPAEWISQNENTEAFSVCIGWPSPVVGQKPIDKEPPLLPSSTPVLVLGGELDTWTPPVDVPKVLAAVGGHARFVLLANSTHVVGEGDTECGAAIVRRFVANPGGIETMDASCAPAVPPVHSVGVYAAQLSGVTPLTASPGSGASAQDLQLAAAAVATAGDAVTRSRAIEATEDSGLAGGSVTVAHGGSQLRLRSDQLVPGVKVSGTVSLSPAPILADGDEAVAHLTVLSAGVPSSSFTVAWTTAGANALAEVEGEVAGRSVTGTTPAP
jgi:pimeloyl-ACP methyl ester carboxylesterase